MLRLAGRGAYGSVWVARDRTGVPLAVKIIEPAQLPDADHGEREQRALALVRQRVPHHPHLVSIFHVSRQDGRLLYAMELADPAPGSPPPEQEGYQADTLAGRLAVSGRLPLPDALRIAFNMLTALEGLHNAGLVHRDVKPGNIVFIGGVPKLADIGLATVIETQMSLAGTAGYVPLDGSTGPDADLYALGKLLYQMVTGCEPADFPAIPAPLLTGPEALAYRRLNRVLLRACAPTRSERFRSSKEMRQALESSLQPASVRWRRPLLVAVILLALLAPWWLLARTGSPTPASTPPESPTTPQGSTVFFRAGDDARNAQNTLARQLHLPLVQSSSIGMRLMLIPPGEFDMGSLENEGGHVGDEFQHRVQISRPFYLGMFEVTQQEYEGVLGHNPSRYVGHRQPVEQVTWNEAVAFCVKLSQREGVCYRLPTEAEWEYACRAGTITRTYLGHSIGVREANIRGGQPLPVGLHAPNAFGLYDMHGNVWEWCHDWYAADFYRHSPSVDPTGPAQGDRRVLRGAGWFDGPGTRETTDRRVRSAYRGAREPPDTRNNRFGFRVVREIEPTFPARE